MFYKYRSVKVVKFLIHKLNEIKQIDSKAKSLCEISHHTLDRKRKKKYRNVSIL